MTALPGIISNIARGWNRDPSVLGLGTPRTGVSAALWESEEQGASEVKGAPDPSMHIVCVPVSSFPVTMFLDGRQCWAKPATAGSCMIVAAARRPRAIPVGPYRVLHLYVPVALILDAAAQMEAPGAAPELIDPACTHDRVVERIARDVLAEMQQGAPLQQLRIDALGLDLAVQLLRRHTDLGGTPWSARPPVRGGLAPWQARRCTEHLRDNLAGDVTLADLAGLAGLSTFHFARMFKVTTGLPPHAYHRRLRCERARELLLASDLPIIEVALAVGYDTPQAFARMFRAETGATPSAWRRERRS